MPVLIRELPPKFTQTPSPVVAGPRPSPAGQNRNQANSWNEVQLANGLGGADPWANWTGPKPNGTAGTPATRVTGAH